MSNETQEATQDVAATNGGQSAPISADAVAPFEGYLAAVPDAEGAGYESILAQIDQAQSITDLDAPWRTSGLEAYKDRQLVVRGIRKMPSDFAGGLMWFLVVDAVEKVTGERVTFTTGAIGVVAQLVKAHALDAFPLTVVPKQSERVTRSGYHVWHLEVMA